LDAGIAGLAMFLAATLLPAAKPDTTLADTAKRLALWRSSMAASISRNKSK